MRKTLSTVVCIAAFGMCGAASAQDTDPDTTRARSGPSISFNAGVSSDYVFRGVSQTKGDPAVFIGVDATQGRFYAGASATTVDFVGDKDTDAEIDLYAGVRPEFRGFNLDLGVVSYLYVGQPGGADYNYVELKAAASRAVGPATLGAAVYWSPDFFGSTEDQATYAEVNGAVSPADRWTVSAALGRQWLSSDLDYTTWNLGVGYTLTPHLALDVRYYDTDQHDFGSPYGARAVASLKAIF
ncbi:TorF family putative porin [Brevundimonas sp.]|uniref:TorF family putative porin n=1 Tax=Brevundimonas sp. TaxID=1871086 RepID=UPI0025C0F362|nr:TorF family putative porin [Brevundimonas sp.]